MARNAQVSLSMVVVALILVFLFIIYVASPYSILLRPEPDPSVPANYVEGSLNLASKHCIIKLGLQGGKLKPENYIAMPYANVESYQDKFLSVEELKAEYEKCIQETALACINDFKDFKRIGYKIDYKPLTAEALLAEKDLQLAINFEVNVAVEEQMKSFDKFKADTLSIRLKKLHNTAKNIVETNKAPDFDLTHLGSIDANTTIFKEKDKQIYSLADHHSDIDTRNYFFLFSFGK